MIAFHTDKEEAGGNQSQVLSDSEVGNPDPCSLKTMPSNCGVRGHPGTFWSLRDVPTAQPSSDTNTNLMYLERTKRGGEAQQRPHQRKQQWSSASCPSSRLVTAAQQAHPALQGLLRYLHKRPLFCSCQPRAEERWASEVLPPNTDLSSAELHCGFVQTASEGKPSLTLPDKLASS